MDYYIGGADVITRVLISERRRQECQKERKRGVWGWRGRWRRKEATNQGRHVTSRSWKGPGSRLPSRAPGRKVALLTP